MSAAIVLLIDFGMSDWYVAEMKGVLATRAPGTPVVDFTHEVPPGEIARGAYLLARGHGTWPAGTVFVVVVDPGVGTARHPIAVASGGRFYVGPDNGVLEAALDEAGAETRIIADLELIESAAETFHGRDLFAPIAARLAQHGEAAWKALGPVLASPVRLPALTEHGHPEAIAQAAHGGRLLARVAHVDRFGNAITTLTELELEAWLGERDPAGIVFAARGAKETEVRGLAATYGPHPATGHGAIALVGSSGRVEIAIPGAHAALALGLAPGAAVELRWEEPAAP
jgi:S-adenosylmethionine hydrolase